MVVDIMESFAVILLSRGNKILGINYTATGGISGCVVDVRKIMQAVLNSNSSGIILVHYAK
jgi:DNA repair protein RadC